MNKSSIMFCIVGMTVLMLAACGKEKIQVTV